MIELLPNIAPLIAAGLLQTRLVRSALMKIVPGAAWYCAFFFLLCR